MTDLPKVPAKKPIKVLFIRNINAQLRRDFKAHCARRGVSMKTKVVRFMQKCVDKDGLKTLEE